MPDSMSQESSSASSPNTVNAAPTKQFFISVLIKDIDFIDALIELIDNSVDAITARFGEEHLRKGNIRVDYTTSRVSVSDNGIGMSVQQAKESAFRFGRPPNAKVVPGSVGAFGVGMKRALFKIGRQFTVESTTKDEHFRVPVDVAAWEKDDQGPASNWTFEITDVQTGEKHKETGTAVEITKLHDIAKDELRNATFGTRLREKLQSAHVNALGRGLVVKINDIDLEATAPEILVGKNLKPIHLEDQLRVEKADVAVIIYAGIGPDLLRDAGWYVFCNGRQIERAEKSKRTGWDTALDTGDKTPRPHWQYRRFRGYIFFESPASSVLPWNTMKTGLNVESPAYRQVSSQMAMALRDVLTFLNFVDAEEDEDGPLHQAIENSKPVQLRSLPPNASFKYPSPGAAGEKLTRISFRRNSDLVDLVKEELGVEKNNEVGEKLFDQFVRSKKLG